MVVTEMFKEALAFDLARVKKNIPTYVKDKESLVKLYDEANELILKLATFVDEIIELKNDPSDFLKDKKDITRYKITQSGLLFSSIYFQLEFTTLVENMVSIIKCMDVNIQEEDDEISVDLAKLIKIINDIEFTIIESRLKSK